MKKIYIVFFFFIFSVNNSLKAAHILSGSMSYECLGNNQYEVTLTIYRDCSGLGALFDNPAFVAIYLDNNLINNLGITVNGNIETIIPEPFGDCPANFPNYCVEKGTYTFIVNLPENANIYTIVYQRCCWSTSFSNIINPPETGITIKTDITAAAQMLCNNQPESEMPFSYAACVDQMVSLPLANFDGEGDSLVYELCTPIKGGGPTGTPEFPGDPNSCFGVQPNPPCPPPFEVLSFVSGLDLNNPFPTESGITLNPIVTTIEFTPNVIGRYVYALCTTEFRDGQQIGYYCQNLELAVFPEQPSSLNSISNDSDWTLINSNQNAQIHLKKESISTHVDIRIFDVNGKLINRFSDQNTNEILLPTDSFDSAIYFIQIQEPNSIQVIKFLHF